jgi:hypothetical protein
LLVARVPTADFYRIFTEFYQLTAMFKAASSVSTFGINFKRSSSSSFAFFSSSYYFFDFFTAFAGAALNALSTEAAY